MTLKFQIETLPPKHWPGGTILFRWKQIGPRQTRGRSAVEGTPMDFGLSPLSRGILVSREAYVAVAQAAERAGFGFLSVNDHIIVPGTLGSAYPYTQGGAWAAAEHGHCFDQLATLAFLAGCTSRLRLLTS